jgi:hypothetical protein
VQFAEARANVFEPRARLQIGRVAARLEARPVVTNFQEQGVFHAARFDSYVPGFLYLPRAVLDGVLDEGLEDKVGHESIFDGLGGVKLHLQTPLEAYSHDVEIGA